MIVNGFICSWLIIFFKFSLKLISNIKSFFPHLQINRSSARGQFMCVFNCCSSYKNKNNVKLNTCINYVKKVLNIKWCVNVNFDSPIKYFGGKKGGGRGLQLHALLEGAQCIADLMLSQFHSRHKHQETTWNWDCLCSTSLIYNDEVTLTQSMDPQSCQYMSTHFGKLPWHWKSNTPISKL